MSNRKGTGFLRSSKRKSNQTFPTISKEEQLIQVLGSQRKFDQFKRSISNAIQFSHNRELDRFYCRTRAVMYRLIYNPTENVFIYGPEPRFDPNDKYEHRGSDSMLVSVIRGTKGTRTIDIGIDACLRWMDLRNSKKDIDIDFYIDHSLIGNVFNRVVDRHTGLVGRRSGRNGDVVLHYNGETDSFTLRNPDEREDIAEYKINRGLNLMSEVSRIIREWFLLTTYIEKTVTLRESNRVL